MMFVPSSVECYIKLGKECLKNDALCSLDRSSIDGLLIVCDADNNIQRLGTKFFDVANGVRVRSLKCINTNYLCDYLIDAKRGYVSDRIKNIRFMWKIPETKMYEHDD